MIEESKLNADDSELNFYPSLEEKKSSYQFLDLNEIQSNPIYHQKLILVDKEIEPESSEIIKVTSYNILASKFLFRWAYGVESQYADFTYRSKNVVNELEFYNSDLLCLQEVDNYNEFYKEKLEKLGYDTIFKMKAKIGRYRLLPGVGAVLAYKMDKYEMIDHKTLIYDDFDKDITNTGIEGIFALLKNKQTGNIFIISSTHTHWNSDEDFIQYGQMACLMYNINIFLSEKKLADVPIIVCGDFNVGPSSNVIKYMKQEKPIVNNAKNGFFCKTPAKKVIDIWEKYPNKFKLNSAYEKQTQTGEYFIEYTHFHRFHKGLFDYIFHTSDLKVKAVREMPKREFLGERAPNKIYPSDHLRIETIFALKKFIKN